MIVSANSIPEDVPPAQVESWGKTLNCPNIAEWTRGLSRQPHKLEVAGSNPASRNHMPLWWNWQTHGI